MKDDFFQRNIVGFPCGTGSPYCMEKLTFSALIKHIFTKLFAKNSISVHMKPCPLNADQNFRIKSVIALV